jgi:hypothetical protein
VLNPVHSGQKTEHKGHRVKPFGPWFLPLDLSSEQTIPKRNIRMNSKLQTSNLPLTAALFLLLLFITLAGPLFAADQVVVMEIQGMT